MQRKGPRGPSGHAGANNPLEQPFTAAQCIDDTSFLRQRRPSNTQLPSRDNKDIVKGSQKKDNVDSPRQYETWRRQVRRLTPSRVQEVKIDNRRKVREQG